MKAMFDEIRMNHDYAQLVTSEYDKSLKDDSTPITRKNVTTTRGYMEKLSKLFAPQQQIFPPNCRYIENTSNGTLVVIEEPPAYRTIKVEYGMEQELETLERDGKIEEWGIDKKFYENRSNMPFNFTLAFPYVIFIMMFDRYNKLMSGQVYLRNARISGYSDYLLKMPMMNISSEGFICYGSRIRNYITSLNSSIEQAIMVFWSAVFNPDYLHNYEDYRDVAGVNTYIGWQALSQIDPMFIYNVDWIKMPNTLLKQIEEVKNHHHASSKKDTDYHELTGIFTNPVDTGKEESVHKGIKRKQRLYYDIAQGIYLTDTFYIHVGDPITWNGKLAFIDSFIGFFESDKIRYIRLELEDTKELITVRFTKKMSKYIYESAKKLRYEEKGTLKNGAVIKEDDIISMKNQYGKHIYKKVFFIRKTRDDKHEARIGSSFYILENTEGKVCDVNKIKFNGMELIKGNEYLVGRSQYSDILQSGIKAVYDGVGVAPSGNLTFKLRGNRGERINRESNSDRPIYPIEDVKEMPLVFNIGRRLHCMRYGSKLWEGAAWGTPNGIVFDRNYDLTTPSISDIEKLVLTNDGTTFHIESNNSEITFDIGDKVVYADWKNPMNMLNVKTLTGFKIDKRKGSLSFVLSDREENLTTVEYISSTEGGNIGSSKTCNLINVGKIRKITNIFNGVSAGTKIQATKGYIPHFPKKDVNIIIGFITDTGGDDPLVLCSNCCTLWFSDMMQNFKRTTMKSKRWAEMQHAPIDISKIQFQAGDIINGTGTINAEFAYLVANDRDHKALRVIGLNNYHSTTDSYVLDTYIKSRTQLDCIPNPRVTQSAQSKMPRGRGMPNFHGLFYENLKSNIKFLDDGRSYLHV